MTESEKLIEIARARMKAAPRKLIKPTLGYLELITQERDYTIESIFPSINGVVAKVTKDPQQFMYETGDLVLCENFHELRIGDYGFKHEFILKSEQFTLKVPQLSSRVHTQMIGQTMATKGRLTNFTTNYTAEPRFCRCVFTRKYNPLQNFSEIIATDEYNQDDRALCMSGLLSVAVGEHVVDVVDHNNDKISYLFIDSKNEIAFPVFERVVQAVTLAFGFASGYFQRDSLLCLQSQDADFSVIDGCLFKELDDTVDSGLTLIDPTTIGEMHNDSALQRYSMLKQAVFSALATKAFTNDLMFRAMKIIAEGNAYSDETRASVYSVALETVRNVIIHENEEKVVPIKDKNFAKELKQKFKELVDAEDETRFNNREAIYKKINDLNQLPNKDSFKAAFDLVGIKLTAEDIKCLESRNAFLHGRLPVEKAEHMESEIKYFTHKLHFLVCALILKYCGYYGWVVNSHKYLELFDPYYKKSVDEATFRTI